MTTTAAKALEALRQINVAASAAMTPEQMEKMAAEVALRTDAIRQHIESTEAELEAMRKDAERYRVLCAHYTAANFNPSDPDGLDLHGKVALIFCFSESLAISGDLSATIDSVAALTQGGK